jgi:annexin A7/11
MQSFDPEVDAKTLRNAMKGLGTDEATITKVIANRSNDQRQKIILFYKTSYGRDLIADLKDELGGNYERAALALFETPVEYDVSQLKKAMKGAGTDEETLIEIIASRPTSHLKQVREAYKKRFGTSLEEEIVSETSGDFQKLLVSLIQCNRSEERNADKSEALKDAKNLFEAGEGQWGTDESEFNKIFALRSPHELIEINKQYINLSGKGLLDVVENEFSGDVKRLQKAILFALIDPSAFFATRLMKACKGAGTDDETLIRILVSRDEIDLNEIKKDFQKLFGVSLLDTIKDECSGDYKNLLLEIASH